MFNKSAIADGSHVCVCVWWSRNPANVTSVHRWLGSHIILDDKKIINKSKAISFRVLQTIRQDLQIN